MTRARIIPLRSALKAGQQASSSLASLAGRFNPAVAGLDGIEAPLAGCAFTMPIPPSTNTLFRNVRGRGRVKTAEYHDFVTLGVTAIRRQRVPHVPGRVVLIVGVERARSTSDISNRLKALEDTIVKAGVIEDDRLVTAIALCWLPAANGLAWVQILPVQPLSIQFHPSPDGACGGFVIAPSNERQDDGFKP